MNGGELVTSGSTPGCVRRQGYPDFIEIGLDMWDKIYDGHNVHRSR